VNCQGRITKATSSNRAWGFAGVIRFLLEPFDARHLLGLFADLDAVSAQSQARKTRPFLLSFSSLFSV